jgi:hypothetical protein
MDYIWHSSIPKRWIELCGEESFKPMKNRDNPFRNTIEFIRETQSYIDKISAKPLQLNSSIHDPPKHPSHIPKISPKSPKSSQPLSKNLSLNTNSRKRAESQKSLPQLKLSIKSMSTREPYPYNDSSSLENSLKILYRNEPSYPHLEKLLSQKSRSYNKLPISKEKVYLPDVNYRSGRLYKKHLMGVSHSTPKIPALGKSGSCSSRI